MKQQSADEVPLGFRKTLHFLHNIKVGQDQGAAWGQGHKLIQKNTTDKTGQVEMSFLTEEAVDRLQVTLALFLLADSQEAKKGGQTKRGDSPVEK